MNSLTHYPLTSSLLAQVYKALNGPDLNLFCPDTGSSYEVGQFLSYFFFVAYMSHYTMLHQFFNFWGVFVFILVLSSIFLCFFFSIKQSFHSHLLDMTNSALRALLAICNLASNAHSSGIIVKY